MSSDVWLPLNSTERSLLREALATYSASACGDSNSALALSQKIAAIQPHPDITIGVYGGQVQWTAGNPFPVRICDYDGDDADLTDLDDQGERCRMWFEPSDEERTASLKAAS